MVFYFSFLLARSNDLEIQLECKAIRLLCVCLFSFVCPFTGRFCFVFLISSREKEKQNKIKEHNFDWPWEKKRGLKGVWEIDNRRRTPVWPFIEEPTWQTHEKEEEEKCLLDLQGLSIELPSS